MWRHIALPGSRARAAAAGAVCACAALAAPAHATPSPRVLVLFAAVGERQMAGAGLSVGIMSAAQGNYSRAQLALDISQGARVSSSQYSTPLALSFTAERRAGRMLGWRAAVARAARAPAQLQPGLLASSIPGGAAYAATGERGSVDAALAADTAGEVSLVSLGSPASLPARIAMLARSRELVVADLAPGRAAAGELARIVAARPAGELLIAIQQAPEGSRGELLWSGAAGLGNDAGLLSSQSTEQAGLISAVDVAPTILQHLSGERPPPAMDGRVITSSGTLDGGSLRGLMNRLRVIGSRRLTALALLMAAWALIALLCARSPPARARALRLGALGVLWSPVVSLLSAAIEPSAAVEYGLLITGCIALGLITDRLCRWPGGAIAPALCTLIAITADSLTRSQLLIRSLLGPDPILGARFYGIGNELKSALAVLVLAAAAGALHPAVRGRRAALSMAACGVLLALVEGPARIGAAVGGVVLVSFSFALAASLLLAGVMTRRRMLFVLLSPACALLLLAVIDLLLAHGSGHYSGSVLHAHSTGELRDLLSRRLRAAWQELRSHAMPAATLIALCCAVGALARRRRLLAPVGGDPAWESALIGSVAAGVVGSLVEDSGPLLLVSAMFTLGCVGVYLWAPPQAAAPAQASTPLSM